MNKLFFISFVAALLTLTYNSAFAQDLKGWIGPAKILKIGVQPNGNVYVTLSVPTLDLGCPGGEKGKANGFLQLDVGAPLFREQYSLLLSAQARNSDVKIYADKCGYFPYAQNTNVCTSDGCF